MKYWWTTRSPCEKVTEHRCANIRRRNCESPYENATPVKLSQLRSFSPRSRPPLQDNIAFLPFLCVERVQQTVSRAMGRWERVREGGYHWIDTRKTRYVGIARWSTARDQRQWKRPGSLMPARAADPSPFSKSKRGLLFGFFQPLRTPRGNLFPRGSYDFQN